MPGWKDKIVKPMVSFLRQHVKGGKGIAIFMLIFMFFLVCRLRLSVLLLFLLVTTALLQLELLLLFRLQFEDYTTLLDGVLAMA